MGKNLKLSELCYYLFFGILFFAKGVGLYDGQAIFKLCLVTAAGFILVKLVLTSYDIREFICIMFLILLGVVIYYNSGEKSALIFLVMMIGFKSISLERMMRIALVIWSAAFGGMVLCSMLGIGKDTVMVHHKFGMDILRRGMGYSHPNVLHVSYAVLVVLILFAIKKEQNRWKTYLWVTAGNLVVFLYSVSYTGFLLVMFFIFFDGYFTYRKNFSVVEKIVIQAIFPFCVLFSLFAPLLLEPDTPLFNILNKLLNRRFYASRLYLTENPLTLFGKRIYASHTYALDSSYVTLLIYGGLVLFLLVCFGYVYAIYMSMRKKAIKELSLLLSFAIAGVIEPFLFNLSFKNLSLLVIAGYLYTLCKNGKEITLFSGFDKEISVSLPEPLHFRLRGVRKPHEKKIAVLAAVIAMIAGGSFYLTVNMPDIVYVEEKYCDIEGESITIDPTEYETDENVMLYGCTNSPANVYMFEGKTIAFERLRDTIRMLFVVFGTVNLLLSFVWQRKMVKEEEGYE